ncbi:hypothetical protein NE237_011191 [Protea cynaroides]|uniref:Uncharacterized protein n=1 Tax=Protea cynaroides TaxID=273540 RepID=A0A9Q0JY16_9MAGN|nr:hypothetical protein NE237_011191 [Protea cynaroides]
MTSMFWRVANSLTGSYHSQGQEGGTLLHLILLDERGKISGRVASRTLMSLGFLFRNVEGAVSASIVEVVEAVTEQNLCLLALSLAESEDFRLERDVAFLKAVLDDTQKFWMILRRNCTQQGESFQKKEPQHSSYRWWKSSISNKIAVCGDPCTNTQETMLTCI